MTDPNAAPPEGEHPPAAVHVVPVPVLVGVFLALMVLTYLTVEATRFDLGGWNLVIAMGIATLKAALVAMFFMHLLYDKPFNALIFVAALVFVAFFIALTLLDTLEYQPDTDPWTLGTSSAAMGGRQAEVPREPFRPGC